MTTSISINENSDNNKNKFIGEGSYGCAYYPGINCIAKKNKKKQITKLQEINFYSKNEIVIGKLVKKISNYKKFYAPIIKFCLISFDKLEKSELNLNQCELLFDEYYYYKDIDDKNYKNLVDNKYFLTYITYIKNKSLKSFLFDIDNIKSFFVNSVNCHYHILNGILLLNNNKIIHNDLHYKNVLYDLKKKNPIIIDFGLSYLTNKMYKINNNIDYRYLKKFYMDYRVDSYNHNIEKRFITFITYNKSDYINLNVESNFEKNILTTNIIKNFVEDCYNSIANNDEILFFFNKVELDNYKKSLYNFYNKFSNKNKYLYFTDIVNELLPYVFAYNDLYSLTINYIYIFYMKKDFIEQDNYLNNICKFYIQILKKSLHPDPELRLSIKHTKLLIEYIFKYISKTDPDNDKYIGNFLSDFTVFLKQNNISIDIVFDQTFAFIDFNLILNKEILTFIRKSKLIF